MYCSDKGSDKVYFPQEGRYEESLSAFEKAASLDPENATYQQGIVAAQEAIAAKKDKEQSAQNSALISALEGLLNGTEGGSVKGTHTAGQRWCWRLCLCLCLYASGARFFCGLKSESGVYVHAVECVCVRVRVNQKPL